MGENAVHGEKKVIIPLSAMELNSFYRSVLLKIIFYSIEKGSACKHLHTEPWDLGFYIFHFLLHKRINTGSLGIQEFCVLMESFPCPKADGIDFHMEV